MAGLSIEEQARAVGLLETGGSITTIFKHFHGHLIHGMPRNQFKWSIVFVSKKNICIAVAVLDEETIFHLR